MMDQDERSFYESVVHGLRSRGWSRIDAEGEALDRLERLRHSPDRIPQGQARPGLGA